MRAEELRTSEIIPGSWQEESRLKSQYRDLEEERHNLDERQGQLDALEAALKSQQEAFRAERNAFLQERQRWEAEVAREREPPPAASVVSKRDSDDAILKHHDQREFGALASTATFRRMGIVVPGDDEPTTAPDSPPEAMLASPPQPSQTDFEIAPPSASMPEEESIDEYTAKFLARIRACSRELHGDAATSRGESLTIEKGSRGRRVEPSGTPSKRERRNEPFQIMPRAVAPEKSVDWSALRELANFSAQSAIDRHTRRMLYKMSIRKLFLTLVAIVCGALLLASWRFAEGGDLALYSGSISLLAAVIWGVQYAILSGRVLVNRAGHLKWVAATERRKGFVPISDREANPPNTR